MKADFDRLTFDARKHYRLVLRQQGRVDVAADHNEQQAILRHFEEIEAVDAIGPCGVPKALPDSFKIAVDPNDSTDLTIGPGRIYVHGLLCENETATTLRKQPDLPPLPQEGERKSGKYVAYLDVWLRLVTPLDDPAIRERALGGPDTAMRAKVVWQVKLVPGDSCADFKPPPASTGTLAARTRPVDPPDGPCVLPAAAGYRGLQNQLYRVEIHAVAAKARAVTYKWSRDNGSVVTAVTGASGAKLSVGGIGPDDALGFHAGQWVELVDDRLELNGRPGALFRIAKPPADRTTIELDLAGGAAPDFNGMIRPKLRRWDQVASAGAAGAFAGALDAVPGQWLDVEDGLQVRFDFKQADNLRVGDYWLIPARTALDDDTGDIEWPVDAAGKAKRLTPHGITHAYCPLAVVEADGRTFGRRDPPLDCRKPFPALTALTADDVKVRPGTCDLPEADTVQKQLDALCARNRCVVYIPPGPDWAKRLIAALAEAKGNLHVCLGVGVYQAKEPVAFEGRGNLVINGSGPGTRLLAPEFESAARFSGFASVTISGLAAEAGRTGTRSSNLKGVRGVLWFVDCTAVVVETARIKCGYGIARAAACVTVLNAAPQEKGVVDLLAPTPRGATAALPTSLRVQHCELTVGLRQVGVLAVNVGRTAIEDNMISVDRAATERFPLRELLQRFRMRGHFRRMLLAAARTAPLEASAPPSESTSPARDSDAPTPSAPRGGTPVTTPTATGGDDSGAASANASVTDGTTRIAFRTPGNLAKFWQPLIEQDLRARPQSMSLSRRLRDVAERLLTNPAFRHDTDFNPWFHALAQQYQSGAAACAAQGVVVAGQTAGEVRICDNTIVGFAQGITVAVRRRRAFDPNRVAAGPDRTIDVAPDAAGFVRITGNNVGVWAAPAVRGRSGVFVGNVDDLMLADNRVALFRPPPDVRLVKHLPPVTGLRVYGVLGPMAVVRHNLVQHFDAGILLHPLLAARTPAPKPGSRQWLIADNRTEGGNSAAEGAWAVIVRLEGNAPS